MIGSALADSIKSLINAGILGVPGQQAGEIQGPPNPNTSAPASTAKKTGSAKPEPMPPYGLQAEQDFADKYEKATGQQLHRQYFDVKMKDTGETHKMLGYVIDGKHYLPQLDGSDLPFQSVQKLGQIPSEHNVAAGHYTPGSHGEKSVPLNEADKGKDATTDEMSQLGFPNSVQLGNTPIGQESNVPVQTERTAPGPGDVTNRTLLQGNNAQVIDPGSPSRQGEATPPIEPGTSVGMDASVAEPSNTDPSTPPTQEAFSANDPYGIKAYIANNKPDPRVKEASDLEVKAAGMKPERIKPKINGLGALGILGIAALAGKSGGDFLKGAVSGVMKSTDAQQEDENRRVATAQNQLLAQAKGIRDQIKEASDVEEHNLRAGQFLQTAEDRRANQQSTLEFKNRQLSQVGAIAMQKHTTDYLKTLAKMGPEARMAQLIQDGEKDTQYIAAMGSLNEKEILQMAQANLAIAKTKTEDETRPLKARLIEAQGDEKNSQVLRNEADTRVKTLQGDLLKLQVPWFNKEHQAKLDSLSAATAKAYADIAKDKATATGKAGDAGGVTPASLQNMQSHFMTLRDKARAEGDEQAKLLSNVDARLAALKSKLFDASGKPIVKTGIERLALGDSSVNDQKEYDKLMKGRDGIDAKITGLKSLAEASERSLKLLTEQAKGKSSGQKISVSDRNAAIKAKTWTAEQEKAYLAQGKG